MPNAKRALGIVVSCLIAACFSATKPLDSTQTGNPPVILTERVALRLSSTDLRVIGEGGAVDPGGAKVVVTNLTTGETFATEANADGSFDVKVTGSPNDVYSVRATAGGRSSSTVFVIRGTAAVGDGRDGSLSCEQRNGLAGKLLTLAAEEAHRSCTFDSDCVAVSARASCYAPSCSFAYVSERGQAEIEQVSRDIDARLCAEYEADGCDHPIAKCLEPPAPLCSMGQCVPVLPQTPTASCNTIALEAGKRFDDAIEAADRSCNDVADCIAAPLRISCREDCPLALAFSEAGVSSLEAAVEDIEAHQCAAFDAVGCSIQPTRCTEPPLDFDCIQNECRPVGQREDLPDCVVCLANSLSWETHVGPGTDDRSTVQPCARYQRDRLTMGDQISCETQLVACSAIASTGAISTALAHGDVQAVLESTDDTVTLGYAGASNALRLTIGMREIMVGGSCEGALPTCVPVPPGFEALRELLLQIDEAMEAAGPCGAFGS